VVVLEMEVEMVVEATNCRRRVSSLCRWYAGGEACFAVEKGMPVAVVTSIERRRTSIGGGDARRGGKKAWEQVRSRGKKAWELAVACEWRRHVEEPHRRVGEAQCRRDISPALSSSLRQSCIYSFMCQ
jgi:antitoxin (DNA-binding transcriptional repressor) of toxin-antitoxin stability system